MLVDSCLLSCPDETLSIADRHEHYRQLKRCQPLFANRETFSRLVEDLAMSFCDAGIDRVVAIDAIGFILGTAIAEALDVGLVPVRKRGKLPVEAERVEFVDYSGRQKTLEMRPDALSPGTDVHIVDEWIETGAQVGAAIVLVERLGACVAGIATIRMDHKEQTDVLRERYRVQAVWEDESE